MGAATLPIIAGTGVYSALNAKRQADRAAQGSPSTDFLAQLAGDLFNQTQPLRTDFINRGQNFLSGNLDVTQSPLYSPLKSAVETQFGLARNNALSTFAPGGALTGALTNLEGQRANALTQGTGQIAQDELNRAFGLATGTPSQSFAGLGAAGGIQGGLAAQQAANAASTKGGLGQGTGYVLGQKAGRGTPIGGK